MNSAKPIPTALKAKSSTNFASHYIDTQYIQANRFADEQAVIDDKQVAINNV